MLCLKVRHVWYILLKVWYKVWYTIAPYGTASGSTTKYENGP